jgi:hypothetical protein
MVIIRTLTEQSWLGAVLLVKVGFVTNTELVEDAHFVEQLQEALRVIQDLYARERHRHLMELRCERSRYSLFLVIGSAAGSYILKRIEVYPVSLVVRRRKLRETYECNIELAKRRERGGAQKV